MQRFTVFILLKHTLYFTSHLRFLFYSNYIGVFTQDHCCDYCEYTFFSPLAIYISYFTQNNPTMFYSIYVFMWLKPYMFSYAGLQVYVFITLNIRFILLNIRFYFTQYTFYFTQYTFLFYSIYVFIILNIRFYFTQYTCYFTQYTFYFTQYTFYYTQYTFLFYSIYVLFYSIYVLFYSIYVFILLNIRFILLNIRFYFLLNIHCFVYLQKVLAPLNEGIHLSKDTALIQNPNYLMRTDDASAESARRTKKKNTFTGCCSVSGAPFHKTCHQRQMTVFVISYWNPCFWLVLSRFVTDFCHLSLKKGFVKRVPGLPNPRGNAFSSSQTRWD